MKWLEKLTGLDKVRKEAEEKLARAEEQEMQTLKEKNPKEYATRRKEPWVGVIDTHVNQENVRNGFFELDWNKYFIEQLREQGYGLEGDDEEQIVDRWFRELCANVVVDGDYGGPMTPVNTGVIDINSVKKKNS
jgi:hypothetical protein